jgi:hypothetical protein
MGVSPETRNQIGACPAITRFAASPSIKAESALSAALRERGYYPKQTEELRANRNTPHAPLSLLIFMIRLWFAEP